MLLHCTVTDDDGSEAQCCKAEVGGCTPANWQHCTGSFIHFSRRASRDHSKIGNKATMSFMMSEVTKAINTLRTGDADLRFYIKIVQDG